MKTKIFLTYTLLLFSFSMIFAQKRVISLAPSITKSMLLLEGEELIVGCTSYCSIAKEDKSNVVGSAISINLEKVLLMKPDLVLATTLTKQEDIKRLQQFGIKTVQFPRVTSYKNMCEELEQIGELIEKKELAKNIVLKSNQKLVDLKVKIEARKTSPSIFIEIGTNPLFAAIPNTFVADFIIQLNAKNIAKDLKYGNITREGVLTKNPDVIFLVTMGDVGKEERRIWKSYSTLSATKLNKIFILDQEKVCSPTVPVFVETLEEMHNLIIQ